MQETQVYCRGASGWTRLIALIEIVGSVIASIWMVILISQSPTAIVEDSGVMLPDGTQLSPEEVRLIARVAFIDFIITLVYTILKFIMGVLLLLGSLNGNSGQLQVWIVFSLIGLVVWVFWTYVEFILVGGGLKFTILLILTLAIEGFSLWVVGTHKEEIKLGAC